MKPTIRRSILRPLFAACALALSLAFGASEVQAQIAGPGPPNKAFTWAETGASGLPKFQDANAGFGWFLIDENIAIRSVPSYSADPTLEVMVDAPLSGHPTLQETFLLQLPANWGSKPVEERALVIGFHPFSISHKSPFVGSTLPTECARRGWMLLSPLGLSQANFASVASQDSLDQILTLVNGILQFDRSRVYTVGFSMGGANALSYAMRKQDPDGLRVAGVVCHTGTMDVMADVASLDPVTGGFVYPLFGGSTPDQDPFEYLRVTPSRMQGLNTVVATDAPVWNLVDVPIYFHVNLMDPNVDLVQHTRSVEQFLSANGFETTIDQVVAGVTHKWKTMNMTAALDFIADDVAPPAAPETATVFEIFADLETTYRYTEVLELDPGVRGRYRISLPVAGNNTLGIQEISGVRKLAVEIGPTGLDTQALMRLSTWTTDGQSTELSLIGVPSAPTTILVNGLPPAASSYDAATETLTLEPNASGAFALVEILL
ncbi:MAG: alpha/beta hydrolase family protein [Planctomycetota bacterium]|jgi:pimeloyl-ACP methyl ester carboxylesterase